MGNKNTVTAHTGASHISSCILRGQIRRCHSPAYRHGEKAWENVRSVIANLILRPGEGWEACTFSVNLPPWGGTSLRHSCHWRRAKVKGYRENKVWVTLFVFPDEAKTSHTPWTSVSKPISSAAALNKRTDKRTHKKAFFLLQTNI